MSARTGKSAGRGVNASRPFFYRGRALYCDGVALDALAEQFGTPQYVYSAEQIRERYRLFEQAFAGERVTVCYAVKANSTLGVLRVLAELGAGFDIVSGGELERVRRASRQAVKRVVFSGVGKQAWEIDAALKAGILLFNVESEAELTLLAARAEAMGVRARFALRVNPDVFADTHPYISTGLREHKFGIDIGLARAIYRKTKKSKWLDAAGVSVHIGSQIRTVEPFAAALARVAALVTDLRKDGHAIRYVDAGGGLGIDYGDSPEEPKFDAARKVSEYAAALKKVAAGLDVHLLVEPGRFIVGQAGALVTRVLVVKRNGEKTFVITDAAMNDLIRPALYQAHHEIVPVTAARSGEHGGRRGGAGVRVGRLLCARSRAAAGEGGRTAGAAGRGSVRDGQASNYNTRMRPAEVLVDGAKAKLIRRRETLKDLLAAEIL